MPFQDRIRELKGNVLPVYTKLARGYSQGLPGKEGYVGQYLFPLVTPVVKEEGKIPMWGKAAFLINETERALGGDSNVLPREQSTEIDFKTTEHDLEYPLDYREGKEAVYDVRKRGMYLTTQGVRLRMEKIQADMAQNLSNFLDDNKVTLSGTSQWTDKTHSIPKDHFKAAKSAIRASCGREPNVCVLGYPSYEALVDHPTMEDKIKYSQEAILDVPILKRILGIENMYVAKGLYCENLTGSFYDLWHDNVIIAYVAPEAELESPSYGYTIPVEGNPFVYEYDKTPKVKHLNSTHNFAVKIVMAGAAYIINNTNA